VKQLSALDAIAVVLSGMGLLYVFNVTVYTPAFYPNANPLLTNLTGLLLSLPIAAMYALMAIAVARTGGDYVWVSRTISPSVGFVTNFTITVISLSFIGIVTPQAVQWSFAEAFYDLGILNKDQGMLNLATYLQGQAPAFWITAQLILITGLVVILSVRLSTAIVRYWTYIAIIIGAVFVVTVVSVGASGFAGNFNALSGSNYNDVITAGQQAGAGAGQPPLFSFDSLYAGVIGALSYLAFFYPAYFAGEIKQNRRTQLLAQIGSLIIYGLFTTVIIAAEYFGEGPAFVNAMASLWVTGSSKLPYLTTPLASGLSIYWTQNPVLVTLFNLGYAGTILAMDVAIFFTLARNLFAWSFDRVMPTHFADVNDRTHTPIKATVVMIVIALIYAYVAVYQFGLLSALFSYGVAGIFLAFIIVAIAAIVFPYRRKILFENADPLAKKKLAGIPLLSILGVLSIIASLIVVYSVILPAIGTSSFLSVLVEGIIPTFIIGAVVFAIAYALRKGQGLDLSMVGKEIPPE
jgi:APA family basic amino acid/polyamine antiporter